MNIPARLGLLLDLQDTPAETGADAGRPRKGSATATQSMNLLMAVNGKVLTYRAVLDMRSQPHIDSVVAEAGEKLELPGDDGLYYLVYVRTGRHAAFPVAVQEGQARQFIAEHHALAVAQLLGLLTYVQPIDPRRPGAAAMLRREFPDSDLPTDGRRYYLVYAGSTSVLLAGEDVETFICDQWALERAEAFGLLTYKEPADTTKGADLARLYADLGSSANLPVDGGLYYQVCLRGGQPGRQALIPLGDAPAWACVLALAEGHPQASELAYREGMLPV